MAFGIRPHLTVAALGLAGSLILVAGARADTLKIGAVLPLTGSASAVGVSQQRGMQYAVQEINAAGGIGGEKVEVLYEDSQGRPDQSVLAFNKLVDLEHVPVIVSAFSGPGLAMAPLATRKKVVVINGGAQADALSKASPYLFNTLPVIGDEIGILTKYLVAHGKKKAAILFENTSAGISGRDDYQKFFTEAGGTVVAQQSTQYGQTDFRPQLLKLNDSQPDVLLVVITVGLPQFAQQYHQLGGKYTVAGTNFFNDPEIIAEPGSEGFIHTQMRSDAPAALAAAFKSATGADMEFWGRQYYNATNVVLTVLKDLTASKQPITGQAVRDAILRIQHFDGITPLDFKGNTATISVSIDMLHDRHDQFVDNATP